MIVLLNFLCYPLYNEPKYLSVEYLLENLAFGRNKLRIVDSRGSCVELLLLGFIRSSVFCLSRLL